MLHPCTAASQSALDQAADRVATRRSTQHDLQPQNPTTLLGSRPGGVPIHVVLRAELRTWLGITSHQQRIGIQQRRVSTHWQVVQIDRHAKAGSESCPAARDDMNLQPGTAVSSGFCGAPSQCHASKQTSALPLSHLKAKTTHQLPLDAPIDAAKVRVRPQLSRRRLPGGRRVHARP